LEKASISQPKILILNEAKENASDLGNIYPAFERVITKLPESICQDNDQIESGICYISRNLTRLLFYF